MSNKLNHAKFIEQTKCAPSKQYEDGSCFTQEALIEIATNYNNKNSKNKINLELSKAELVEELKNRLSDKCSEQTCWLRLDIAKALDDEIKDDTFRPEGPSKKYDWLSTTHINDVISQYHSVYNNFNFLGAVPLDFDDLPVLGIKNLNFDELIKQGKTKIGLVINQDEHWKSGSHWVGLFIDFNKNGIYYFDSVGSPPLKLTKKFITKIAKYMYKKKYNEELPVNNVIKIFKTLKDIPDTKLNKVLNEKKYLKNLVKNFDIRFNNIQHQFDNSECGVYSINFILNMAEGKEFDDVINNVKKDEVMNTNRKIFFRNVN
jgi:hypothetical protein